MIVRRDRAALRGGAGLLLAVACLVGPAVAQAAPVPAEITPMAACTPESAASASATSAELGGPVEVTGDCFPTRSEGTIEIFIQGNKDSRQSKKVDTEGTQSVDESFTPTVAGEYQVLINVGDVTATTKFTVAPVEEEPPVEEPSDSPEDPTEPPTEDPVDPPEETEEPTDPETPTEEPVESSDPRRRPRHPRLLTSQPRTR